MFSSMHHSFIVEPWEALPGGVSVIQADDPTRLVVLLRDRDEVTRFCATLLATQSLSQARVGDDPSDPDIEGQCNARAYVERADGSVERFRCADRPGHEPYGLGHRWGDDGPIVLCAGERLVVLGESVG